MLRTSHRMLMLGGTLALLATSGCSTTDIFRGRSYPDYARIDDRGGQERYRVCHKGRNVLTLPAPAVDAHLRHGDSFGSCSARDRRRHDDHGRSNRGRGRGGR